VKKITFGQADISKVVAMVLGLIETCNILLLSGPLGAGKTTLIKALAEQLGVREVVTSPTYTYVQSYRMPGGKILYHFDLYRMRSIDEFLAQGFDEILACDEAIVVIEWPEIIRPILESRERIGTVTLDYDAEQMKRTVIIDDRL
jgi:tRNA threonylcarbamoyladenosine biosynthesis protein TsaE